MKDAKIFCLVGYYALHVQQRLAKDASLCPKVSQELILSEMSAAAWDNFKALLRTAGSSGCEFIPLMSTPLGLTEQLEARLRPADWPERITKSFVSLGVMADFHRILIANLHPDLRSQLDDIHWTCGHNQWAEKQIKELINDDERAVSRLSLWGRRVLGDVMSTVRASTERFPGLCEELEIDMETVIAELSHSHRDRMVRSGLQA